MAPYYYTDDEQNIDRFQYQKVITDNEARDILSQFVQQISASQEYLRQAIGESGDQILHGWRKRTQPKRSALLREAEPSLPANKYLLVDLDYSGAHWQTVRAYRKYHLLPWLDVESLVKSPAALIGLIHTRARDSPVEWAPFDYEQMRSAFGLGCFDLDFNPGAVIVFGPQYGTLTPWDQRIHSFDTAGYPRARLILEAQAILMQFLERCVSILLRGMASVDASGASKWHETINSGLKMTGDSAIWSSYVHRPFTGPPRLNTSSLLASAKARLDSSSDHLWLLQTEPAYLKRYLRNLGQTTIIQEGMSNEIANGIINGQVHDDIVTHRLWHATVLEFEHLHELYRRYEDSITPGSPLPHKADNALGALEVWLVNRLHPLAKSVGETPSQRPGFRHLYTTIVSPVKRTDRVVHTKALVKEEYMTVENGVSTGLARGYRDERLWWVLTQLQGPPDSETRLRYDMLLAMLDDHLNICSKSERARLDGFLYEKLSDFVVVLDLLSTIRMHRPRNSNRTVTDCLRTEDRLAWRMFASNAISSPKNDRVYEEISLLRTFRATSSPSGPRNKQWLNNMMHYITLHKDIGARFRPPLLHWEAPDYVARLNLKREQILQDSQKSKIPESEYTFLPLCPATRNRPEYDLSSPRVKIKTQGVPPVHLHEGEIEDTPNPLPEAKVITVSKRALAIFRCMFPEQREERQKNIDWNAFVDSMVEAGFFARNGGGSIVVFEEKSGDGKIIFHRPHPEPSIDPIMLQSMGRRMNKWFDWTRETFSLARK